MPVYSESEILIAEAARALAEKAGGVARARKSRRSFPDFDKSIWAEMAQSGWIGLAALEEKGGLGLGAREMASLCEALGAYIPPEPIAPALATALFLSRCENPLAASHLESVLAGTEIILPIFSEDASGCADGHFADAFLLQGKTGVHLVSKSAPGVTITHAEAVDGGARSQILASEDVLRGLPLLATGPEARAMFDEARDLTRLGHAALLVGLAARALDMTVDYMKTRRQFGAAIGSFQALQHRAASVYVGVTSTRALVYEAASAFATPKRSFAAAAAKARSAQIAVQACEECIQFHGAIGFADEHDIGLFLRRAMSLAAAAGHLRACRQLIAEVGA